MTNPHTALIPERRIYKCLPRSILVDRDDINLLRKVRLKAVNLKKVFDLERDEDSPPDTLLRHRYFHRKRLNNLKEVDILFLSNLGWLNHLKHAKNLKTAYLRVGNEDLQAIKGFAKHDEVLDKIFQCLRKFPKSLQNIRLQMEKLNVKKGHLEQAYQVLESLPRLKTITRLFGVLESQHMVKREYQLINQCMARCPRLEEFEYNFIRYQKDIWRDGRMNEFPVNSDKDHQDFQELMRQGVKCKFITNLTLSLNEDNFATVDRFRDFMKQEPSPQIHGRIEAEKETMEEEKVLVDESNSFFRFELFENLRSLSIDFQAECLYHLGPFIVESFAALKKLKQLHILIFQRPIGTGHIFEALDNLPLLEQFNLAVPFLRVEEWKHFYKFLDKQSDLASLTFSVVEQRSNKQGHLEQEKQLIMLGDHLQNHTKLRHLELLSSGFTLASLSKLFEKLEMKDQLKALNIQAFDDVLESTRNIWELFKGICEFIKRQKGSLHWLDLDIQHSFNPEIIKHLSQSISELQVLRKLNLHINDDYAVDENRYKDFWRNAIIGKTTARMGAGAMPQTQGQKNTFFPHIRKMLRKMNSVEWINLYFGSDENDRFGNEFVGIVNTLSEVKSLRILEINVPFKKLEKRVRNDLQAALLRLQSISSIVLDVDFIEKEQDQKALRAVRKKLHQRQIVKCELMF